MPAFRDAAPPRPREIAPGSSLPHALTFFLTAAERAAVLHALRKRGRTRARALLAALHITPHPTTKEDHP